MKHWNKRFSLAFLSQILGMFGYHFFEHEISKKDYRKHKNKISDFVQKPENCKNNDSQYTQVKKEITSWIQKKVISIPEKLMKK